MGWVHCFAGAWFALFVACSPQPVDRVSVDARGGSPSGGGDGQLGPGVGGNSGGNSGGLNPGGEVDASFPDVPSPPEPDAEPGPPDVSLDLPPERPMRPAAYLIVGDPLALQPGDMIVRDLLEQRLGGLAVDVFDDDDPEYLDYARLVVLTSSCAPEALSSKYRNATVSVIALHAGLLHNLGMTTNEPGVSFGVEAGGQSLTILNRMHPLAAGLTGTVGVLAAPGAISWGSPGSAAIRIAHLAGQMSRSAIFAYARGVVTPGGTTPGKRIAALFTEGGAASQLTDNGLRLLGAAIDWAKP